MKDLKDKKVLFITFIVLLLILTTSLSYAYFSTSVSGNDNAKDVVVETGTLKLVYTDSPEIVAEHIKPGWSTTKVVTVKNTGTLDTAYNLVWQELTNEITNNELVISASCERLDSSNAVEGTCESIIESPVVSNKIKKNISIESGTTHKYTFTITFKEMNQEQDYNQNKKFNGVIGVEEYKKITPTPIYCTFDGELTQGAEYTNGQYTYRYMQEYKLGYHDLIGAYSSLVNMDSDGWSVTLTDKYSTDPVTSKVCTYINDKPVISASAMFFQSSPTSIDLSNFNTSNIINMEGMFWGIRVATLDLSSFDTSNVTNMSDMFDGIQVATLDLSNFDTSKVTKMNSGYCDYSGGMFSNTKVYSLDLSSFDTSKVTDMSCMFQNSDIATLDLSSFDTSNVTDMRWMFKNSQAIALDLSNFDTSNVTDMGWMFQSSSATTLDLSSFDTSKVTDMSCMFQNSDIATLDLSSFDTSNVTDMRWMFQNSQAIALDLSNFDTSKVTNMTWMFSNSKDLKTIYVSNKFKADTVNNSNNMFNNCTSLVGGNGTKYDSTKTDKTYARIDGGSSNPGYFTSK